MSAEVRKSAEIAQLSQHFVMVNCQDDEEPADGKFYPDGGYYPRTLFLDGRGEVITELHHPTSEQYKYFYGSPKDFADSMSNALVYKGHRMSEAAAAREAAEAGEGHGL